MYQPIRAGRRVVVLDDDPTGTQATADITVALRPDTATLRRFHDPQLYVLTNTRALEPDHARRVLRDVRVAFPPDTEFVLRGDSTLRGHIKLEMDALGLATGVGLIVPAFPAAGRITVGGVHRVRVDDAWLNAADTEFARDPVFGYRGRTMTDWAAEAGLTDTVVLDRSRLGIAEVRQALLDRPAGGVVLCDAETDADIATIADGYREASAQRNVVVRCAAPLAALIAEHPGHLLEPGGHVNRLLVVCGSHTTAASRQLAALGRAPHVLPTAELLNERTAGAAVDTVVTAAAADLRGAGIAVVCTERTRRAEHATLAQAATVMRGLMQVVRRLTDGDAALEPDAVIAKGGITSAETAATGLGGDSAVVRGQIVTGVPLWDVARPNGSSTPLAVVPGNVGDDETLVTVARFFTGTGVDGSTPSAQERSD